MNNKNKIVMAIYAVLFVSSEPVAKDKLQTSMKLTSEELEIALQDLTKVLKESSPLTLQEIENSVQLVTRPEFSANIRETLNNIPKKIKLSQESLETLTIIAYKQPITKAEIDELKGVDSEKTLYRLSKYGLIKTIGSLSRPGMPVIYQTTTRFLKVFGLRSLADLPPITLSYRTI